MKIQPNGVTEIDAFVDRLDTNLLFAIWRGETSAVCVKNLVSLDACKQLTSRLLASQKIVEHSDVEGLRVIGLSHFQAVRNKELTKRYLDEGQTTAGALRSIAFPYASPFDSTVAFLTQSWQSGCQYMELPTEGRLAPFTVRIYKEGVGIEPHQDILSAESPDDIAAKLLTMQFGANIYLSMGNSGGALELFETDYSAMDYKDLSDGPRVVSREKLSKPFATILPQAGDLIIFPSHCVHAVTESDGEAPRITVSCFIGFQDEAAPLKLWA